MTSVNLDLVPGLCPGTDCKRGSAASAELFCHLHSDCQPALITTGRPGVRGVGVFDESGVCWRSLGMQAGPVGQCVPGRSHGDEEGDEEGKQKMCGMMIRKSGEPLGAVPFRAGFTKTISGLVLLFIVFTSPSAAAQDSAAPTSTADKNDQRQQLILVVGAPGTDEYGQAFSAWAARWEGAAARADAKFVGIGMETQSATTEEAGVKASETDLQRLREAITSASQEPSTEPLWIVYIGHGTFDGRTASWNLQGPDISAEQLADACKSLRRPLSIVACASCTAPFINALSGPDRVIVSATKDGNQIQYSRFGDAMSLAISTLEADINRDGQTSLLEAWLFATRRTEEFYKTEGRLATEHALLDDNGDAKGVRGELFQGDRLADNVRDAEQVDGKLAARWHFVRSAEERRLTPEQREDRDAIEDQILALRSKKGELQEADYLLQLEALLLPLAELYESAEEPK